MGAGIAVRLLTAIPLQIAMSNGRTDIFKSSGRHVRRG